MSFIQRQIYTSQRFLLYGREGHLIRGKSKLTLYMSLSEFCLWANLAIYLQQKRDILQRFKLSQILTSALSCA